MVLQAAARRWLVGDYRLWRRPVAAAVLLQAAARRWLVGDYRRLLQVTTPSMP